MATDDGNLWSIEERVGNPTERYLYQSTPEASRLNSLKVSRSRWLMAVWWRLCVETFIRHTSRPSVDFTVVREKQRQRLLHRLLPGITRWLIGLYIV